MQKYVPGAEECSITLVRDKRAATAASTGALPTALDEIQYAQGYGPCRDAGRCDEIMHVDDMSTERRWRAYTPLAIEHGVQSSLSLMNENIRLPDLAVSIVSSASGHPVRMADSG